MCRLLLVVVVLCCAQSQLQGAVTSQHPQRLLQALGDATKALQAAQQSLEDALKNPPSSSSVSVVQDWSLVCKELCGAGLGVAPCANYCPKSGSIGMVKILNATFDLAKCEQLTGSQNVSMCHGVEPVKSYGDRLCSTFCHQRRRTLHGCSSCQLLSVLDKNEDEEEVSTEQLGTSQGSTTGGKSALHKFEIVARAADADQPDWDEMCKALCKTGDGGSLCNCDLSPFTS